MKSALVRQTFLSFFAERGHKIVSAAPLVRQHDPSLLFTNAGMNPFKGCFLSEVSAPAARVVNSQPCLRVSGKHNDLEQVGLDAYHHTLFEMLGNWSFGDYFREEAMDWAFTLLTDVYGLDKDRLYVSYFGGSKALSSDEETKQLWSRHFPSAQVLEGDEKDNFWEMGLTGPCGPCTEVHIDLRSEKERQQVKGSELVNQGHPLVIELWNLVFMRYDRRQGGQLVPLEKSFVDTGMGLDRLAMVLQGKTSTYETDIFLGIKRAMEEGMGIRCTRLDKAQEVAVRVIADHVRALVFALSEDVRPSNVGAGYVLRRLLRRAMRYAYSFLHIKEPFLCQLSQSVVGLYGEAFPNISRSASSVKQLLRSEEESFLSTLARGMKRLDRMFELHAEQRTLGGKEVFELYDTYGFPVDLTRTISQEKGFCVEEEGFAEHMERQKVRARQANTRTVGDWTVVEDASKHSQFVGYDKLAVRAKVLRHRRVEQEGRHEFHVVLDRTPFYPQGGGQVGDTGLLHDIPVQDTQRENDLIVHTLPELPDKSDMLVETQVCASRRAAIEANHSATHLLHATLRQVLGKHVAQRGSLVNEKALRFDFSHPQRLSEDEVQAIETQMQQKIDEHVPLQIRRMPLSEAKKLGAMALFGEKYEDQVRVVSFGDKFSIELCGGTHVSNTAQILTFIIIKAGSVAAGVQRISAYTHRAALQHMKTALFRQKRLALLMKTKEEHLEERWIKSQNELKKFRKQLKQQAVAQRLGGEKKSA